MPDTYLDKSIVGFNADDDLRTKVDTYNRLSSVLNPIDHPALTGKEPSTLRNNFAELDAQQATSKKEETSPFANISISEALESDDATIRNYGKQAIANKYNSIPEFKNDLGRELESSYEDSKKFLDKKYGFSKMRDNEDFYYKNDYQKEGTAEHIFLNPLRFLGRVAGQSILKLGQGFGYMGSMLGSIGDKNYMQSVADNGFSRYFSDAEQSFKDSAIPVYKEAGFDQKGFFSKLGDASFWNDTVADGVAFMASQMIDSAIMGNVGKIGLIGELGEASINTASILGKAGRVGKAIGTGIDTALKFSTGAEDVAGMVGWARRIAGESAFEASDGFKTVKDQLTEDRKNGRNNLTDDQIDSQASSQAAGRFKDNLLILGASGAFENKFIFQPLRRKLNGLLPHEVPGNGQVLIDDTLNASKKAYKYATKLGKLTNWKDPLGRLQFYGKRGLEATFMEGYWEENAQLASERMHNGKNTYDGFWKQLIGQTIDATKGNDPEVAESIGVGGIIGVLGGSASAKAFGGKGITGERRTELSHIDKQVARLNQAKDAFLSLNDIYKTKEDGTLEVDEFGDSIIDEEKAKAKAVGISEFSKRMVQVDDITNPVLRKALKENLLSDYTYAAIKAGVYDRALDKFENLHNHIDEIPGFKPDPNTIENPKDIAESFKAYKKIYDDVEQSKVIRPQDVKLKDFQEDEDFRKRILYQIKSSERNTTLAADDVNAAILEENNDPLNDSSVQEYNTLSAQEQSLKQFKDYIKGNDEFHKDHIESELKRIAERKKEIKDSLKDKFDDDSLFEHKGVIINKKKYAQYTDPVQHDIVVSNDFQNQRTLGQLQASKAQKQFEAYQLSNKTLGHQNYVAYNEFLKKTAQRDEEVDNATAPIAPVIQQTTTQAPVQTTQNAGQAGQNGGTNTGTQQGDAAKAEARRVIKDILNKLFVDVTGVTDDELDSALKDPVQLNELVNEHFDSLVKNKASEDDFDNFLLGIDLLYPVTDEELAQDDTLSISSIAQMWVDKVDEALSQEETETEEEKNQKLINEALSKIPIEIRSIVVTDENYNSSSNLRDKSDYLDFLNQIILAMSPFEKATPEKLAQLTREDIDGMLSSNKVFANQEIRDKSVEALYNKYHIEPIETEEEKKTKELQAKKDDIERRRKIELDSIKEVANGKGIMGKIQNAILDGKFVHTTVVAASPGSKEFTVLNYSDTREEAEKIINDKYDSELAELEEKAPEEEKWNDVVPKAEYNDFINNNKATEERLKDIADKVMKGKTLSDAEKAIFAGKTSEINNIIKDIKDKEDKEAEEKRKAEEEKRGKEEEERRKKILEKMSSEENQESQNIEYINRMIDEARQKGEFTFAGIHFYEVQEVLDNKVVLRSMTDENILRTHNTLRNFLRDSVGQHRIRIINQSEDTKKWFPVPNPLHPPKGPIAVLVDEKGEIIKFNNDGYPDSNGLPVAFQYSVNEYKPENIGKTREGVMSGFPTKLPEGHGFTNSNPLMDMNYALAKGIPIYGTINVVTNGKISSLNSTNTLGQNTGRGSLRTMQDLIDDGFIVGSPETLMSGQETYWVNGSEIIGNIGGTPQTVKVGQAYIIDANSGLVISFNGKKLRDLKVSDSNTFYKLLMKGLDAKDGKIEFATADDALQAYTFLRQVIYSEVAQFKIGVNPNIVEYSLSMNPNGKSLADEQINFNYDGKTSFFDLADIHIPGETDAQDYLSFIRNNFVTSSTPAQISEGVERFEKLNKRVIFTLDKSQKEFSALNNNIVTKPTLIDGKNPEAFVGKTFKTPKGNIMKVTSYDNVEGYVFESEGKSTKISAEAFAKDFNKFEEVVKETPDPQTVEQFNNRPKLTKEEMKSIVENAQNYNEDEADFGC